MIILIFLILILSQAEPTIYKASDSMNYYIKNRILRPSELLFFTEGLTFADDNTLLESTGLYGDSEIHYITNIFSDDSGLKER